MNSNSIHTKSLQLKHKKSRLEQDFDHHHTKLNLASKSSKYHHKQKQGPSFELNFFHNSSSWNQDYHQDKKSSLKSLQFYGLNQCQKIQGSQKNFSSQQDIFEMELKELEAINILTARILQLENNFVQVQTNYAEKICILKQILLEKNRQTQRLNKTIQSLSSEQQQTHNEVALLMNKLCQSPAKNDERILQNDRKLKNLIKPNKGLMLPLKSKNDGEQGIKGNDNEEQEKLKSKRLKMSHTLIRPSQRIKQSKAKGLKKRQTISKKQIDEENPEQCI